MSAPRRPKGVQTASSSQAAELVIQTNAANAFALFQAGLNPISSGGSSGGSPLGNAEPEGEFMVVLRRLAKKDPTTKLKALRELEDLLLQDSPDEPVVACLAEWCQLYVRFALARPKQIRERLVAVMGAVFCRSKTVKRAMEKHIKSILGPWLCHLHDPEREVRAAASQAWRQAFPDEAKEVAGLRICRREVFDQLAANVATTPQAIKADQKTSPEETEQIHECLLSGSLLAAGFVLRRLQGVATAEELAASCPPLLTPEVWKALGGAEKAVSVRVGFYEFLIAVMQCCPDVLRDYSLQRQVTKGLLLDGFSEKDSAVFNHWWPALLAFLQRYPECWDAVPNPSTTLMPRLFALLRRTTGIVSLEVTYQSLLPLLVLIPTPVIDGCKEGGLRWFSGEFLSCLWKGIQADAMIPIAVPALVDSYVECWKYFAVTLANRQAADDPAGAAELQRQLLRQHLLPATLSFLLNKSIRAAPSAFAAPLGRLLSKLGGHPLGAELGDHFWRPLFTDVLRALAEDRDLAPAAAEGERPAEGDGAGPKGAARKAKAALPYPTALDGACPAAPRALWVERTSLLLQAAGETSADWTAEYRARHSTAAAEAAHGLLAYAAKSVTARQAELLLVQQLWQLVDWTSVPDQQRQDARADVRSVLLPVYRQLSACLPSQQPLFLSVAALLGTAGQWGLMEAAPLAHSGQLLAEFRRLCPKLSWPGAGALLATLAQAVALPALAAADPESGGPDRDALTAHLVALAGDAADLGLAATLAGTATEATRQGVVEFVALLATQQCFTAERAAPLLRPLAARLAAAAPGPRGVGDALALTHAVLRALSGALRNGIGALNGLLPELLGLCFRLSLQLAQGKTSASLYLSPALLQPPRHAPAPSAAEPPEGSGGERPAAAAAAAAEEGCDLEAVRAVHAEWRGLVVGLSAAQALGLQDCSALLEQCENHLEGQLVAVPVDGQWVHHDVFCSAFETLSAAEQQCTGNDGLRSAERWLAALQPRLAEGDEPLAACRRPGLVPTPALPTALAEVWVAAIDEDTAARLARWGRLVRVAVASADPLASRLPGLSLAPFLHLTLHAALRVATASPCLTSPLPSADLRAVIGRLLGTEAGSAAAPPCSDWASEGPAAVPGLCRLLRHQLRLPAADLLAAATLARLVFEAVPSDTRGALFLAVLPALLEEEGRLPPPTAAFLACALSAAALADAPAAATPFLGNLVRRAQAQLGHGLLAAGGDAAWAEVEEGLLYTRAWLACSTLTRADATEGAAVLDEALEGAYNALLAAAQGGAAAPRRAVLAVAAAVLRLKAMAGRRTPPEETERCVRTVIPAVRLVLDPVCEGAAAEGDAGSSSPAAIELPLVLEVICEALSQVASLDQSAALRQDLHGTLFEATVATGEMLLRLLASPGTDGAVSSRPLLTALPAALQALEDCPPAVYVDLDARRHLAAPALRLLHVAHLQVLACADQYGGDHFPGEAGTTPSWLIQPPQRFPVAESPVQCTVARLLHLCLRSVSLSLACVATREMLLAQCGASGAASPALSDGDCVDDRTTSAEGAREPEMEGATDEDAGAGAVVCPLPPRLADLLLHPPPLARAPDGAARKVNLRTLQRGFQLHAASALCRLAAYSWLAAWRLVFELKPDPQELIKWIRQTSLMPVGLELCFAYLLTPVKAVLGTAPVEPLTGSNVVIGSLLDSVTLPDQRMTATSLQNEGVTAPGLAGAGVEFLRQAMAAFPSMVRGWWSSSDRPVANLVEKFVVRHISPHVIAAELEGIQIHLVNLKAGETGLCADETVEQMLRDDEVDIKVLPGSGQVVITYNKDDVVVAMQLKVPASYPLRTIDVAEDEASRRLRGGIREEKWRLWLLKMTIMLFSQNTTLWKCVLLWCSNLAKHFAGVEPCPICYSIVSQANQRLPELKCQVCRNSKFHSLCLLKWFRSAGNNSCPICRSPWY